MIAQLNYIAQIWWQWMAGMFWQVSLLIILVTLLDMAIRRWAWPQVRYVLWGLVFLKLIIPPTWQMPTSIVSWIQPRVEEQISIQTDTAQISRLGVPSPTVITTPVVTTKKASWQAIVFLTWLAGMIVFGMMLIIKLSQLPKRPKKQDAQNTPEWFNELLVNTSQRVNLKKVPVVVFSKDAISPAVYGIFSPILLLPERCLEQLTQEQAEHVLMHELCHLKRGDLLVHWFCLILQVVYWFNPLLIWTRKQMKHVCEICCDLSVADILREKTTAYRDTLLATARELLAETVEPGLGLLGVFEEPFRIITRLRWLEKRTWENKKRKIATGILTSLVMVICVMPMAGLSQTNLNNNEIEIRSGANFKANDQDTQNKDNAFKSLILIEGVILEFDKETNFEPGMAMKLNGSDGIMETRPSLGIISEKGITIGKKSYADLKALMEDLKMDSGVHILSEPKIMSMCNKKASIEYGSSGTTPEIPATEKEQKGTLSLEVTSLSQENGYIIQEVKLSLSQNSNIKTIGTNVSVKDGNTLVIGHIQKLEDTITTKNSSDKKDLYMFLTPHIIKTQEDQNNFSQGASYSGK